MNAKNGNMVQFKGCKLNNENKCNLIDLREESELTNSGSIENSTHIPRGLL